MSRASLCFSILLCSTGITSYLQAASPASPADSLPFLTSATSNSPDGAAVRPSKPVVIAPPSEIDLLERVRETNNLTYTNLKSVVCSESIQRYKGSLTGENGRSIDNITANLSFESGNERYTDIRQNNRRRTAISALAGAWSEGELGTLLSQTLTLLKTQKVSFVRSENVDGRPASVYEFEVVAEDSPWSLVVASQTYKIGFRTLVWASTETADVLKIARTSLSIPGDSHISELQWNVTLQRVEINGNNWLLPKGGEYAVLYDEVNRREWNVMNFSNYHRYGAEVALRFDNIQ